tara:strand:+ start:100 stop:1437 length:1338 start_codon:yes stop_codon:yes gene_type:complete
MKKFYNRNPQLISLRKASKAESGILDVIVGRRRVGKTRLIQEAFSTNENVYLYLFISRKSEQALVDEFSSIIKSELNAKFFRPASLKDSIEFLLDYSINNPITVVIDEFQDIAKVNASFYSDLQNLWDSYKLKSQMNLVVCGSLYNLMTKIFKDKDEPLFNRQDHYYHVRPLTPSYIKNIMVDQNNFNPKNYLLWWCLSGGIPKYLEWIIDAKEDVLNTLISDGSPLIKEGHHRLVEDFGEEHRTYFDILGAIASGYNTKPKIVDYLGYQINDAFPKLTDSFEIINKLTSMDASANTKTIRYEIADPFLRFWFRFIYKNRSAIEIGNYSYIKDIIERDYTTYSGIELEHLLREILIESMQFNRIGNFWDRKGHNEIDIIAINDTKKTALFVEVKLQQKYYDEQALFEKVGYASAKLKLKGYTIEHRGVSLDTLEEFIADFPVATT